MAPRNRRPPHGFTLVELLVVIGIIIVLIGILLPVLGHVRKAAWDASSQASIANLASAIERYRQDFNAYPGVIGNAAFGNAGTATLGSVTTFTMTENLTLSLLGGLEPTTGLTPAMIGNGPMSHNPLATARKRFPPYIDVNLGKNLENHSAPSGQPIDPLNPWNLPVIRPDNGNVYTSVDSPKIPEFIDAYPDAMPILYFRARSGARSFAPGTENTPTPQMDGATMQYNVACVLPYLKSQNPFSLNGTGNTEFPGRGQDTNGDGQITAADTLDFPSATAYFQNPGVKTEVRQKDGFWLIGAGPDRKYGTKDDKTNFGPL